MSVVRYTGSLTMRPNYAHHGSNAWCVDNTYIFDITVKFTFMRKTTNILRPGRFLGAASCHCMYIRRISPSEPPRAKFTMELHAVYLWMSSWQNENGSPTLNNPSFSTTNPPKKIITQNTQKIRPFLIFFNTFISVLIRYK